LSRGHPRDVPLSFPVFLAEPVPPFAVALVLAGLGAVDRVLPGDRRLPVGVDPGRLLDALEEPGAAERLDQLGRVARPTELSGDVLRVVAVQPARERVTDLEKELLEENHHAERVCDGNAEIQREAHYLALVSASPDSHRDEGNFAAAHAR
jgi:hypothetical protein